MKVEPVVEMLPHVSPTLLLSRKAARTYKAIARGSSKKEQAACGSSGKKEAAAASGKSSVKSAFQSYTISRLVK